MCRLHFHEIVIHRNGGSSRLILALLFGDVMGAPSVHHAVCAPVSEKHVCCFMFVSFLLCRFVSGCSHTPVWSRQFFFAVNSFSFFIRHSVFSFFNSIQFCFLNSFQFFVFYFFTSTPSLQACRKRLDHLLSLHQLKTGPVSSKQIHIYIVYTPFVVHVQPDHPSLSRTEYDFLPSLFAATNPLVVFCARVCHVEILLQASHGPAAPESMVTLIYTNMSFTSMTLFEFEL